MSAVQLKKVSWWHEAIFDWELQHPDRKLYECAAELGVTQAWLSTIRNSDVYREYAAARRTDHNGTVSTSIVDRVEDVAGISLSVLKKRIAEERESISLQTVNDTCSMALRALGFGANRSRTPDQQVTVQINMANPALLDRAREKMRVLRNGGAEAGSAGGPIAGGFGTQGNEMKAISDETESEALEVEGEAQSETTQLSAGHRTEAGAVLSAPIIPAAGAGAGSGRESARATVRANDLARGSNTATSLGSFAVDSI